MSTMRAIPGARPETADFSELGHTGITLARMPDLNSAVPVYLDYNHVVHI